MATEAASRAAPCPYKKPSLAPRVFPFLSSSPRLRRKVGPSHASIAVAPFARELLEHFHSSAAAISLLRRRLRSGSTRRRRPVRFPTRPGARRATATQSSSSTSSASPASSSSWSRASSRSACPRVLPVASPADSSCPTGPRHGQRAVDGAWA
ncbi:hypothetical protein ACQJBY_006032 [Aegilops geniculata]